MTKHFTQKNIQSVILPTLLFLILSLAIFIGVRKQSQSFHFEDETDHVAVGWMMNRFDKNLYSDLSTNHQPLPVLAGAVMARVIPYTTMFELVERLRISMFVYGLLWGIIVALRFKWRGIFSYGLTYSVGYYFFAWHVLAESFAAPAILFIFLLLFEKMYLKPVKLFEQIDGILSGISLALVTTSLLPLWPVCLISGLGLLYLSSPTSRKYMFSSGITMIALIALLISPVDWFRETVLNNLRYFLPYTPKLTASDWLTVLSFPLLSALKPLDKLAQVFLLPLSLGIVLMGSILLRQKKISRKNILSFLYLYFLLVITNPRVLHFPTAFYQGFHLFPFVAAFFAVVVSVAWQSGIHISPKKAPFILSFIFIALFLFNSDWARRKTDKLNEYYVQYGTQDSYARLLSVFKQEGDTFFSGPNGFGFINMRADVPIAGRQLFHLQWAYLSPELRAEFHQLLAEKPPTFIYLLEDQSGYHNDLQPVLKEQYTEVVQNKKHRTFLYFLNKKIEQTTEAQKKYLEEQDFHFRTAADGEIF